MTQSVFYAHITGAAAQTGLPVAEIGRMAHACGVSGVEVDWADLQRAPAELQDCLQYSGLVICGIYGFYDFGNDADITDALRLIDAAQRLGAQNVLLVPGFFQAPADLERVRQNIAAALRPICAYAAERGVQVSLEDYDSANSPCATTEQLLWFFEQVEGLRCTFDTGNFLVAGEDGLAALERLLPHIGYVHCKDRALAPYDGEDGGQTLAGVAIYPAPVGSGCIPLHEILRRLRQGGYDGVLAIEHFGLRNQWAGIERSAAFLQGENRVEEWEAAK
ncbi:MAG: sugar phosphate isomerase/epimerase [Oscillospiraceae bacterium]|jgi:sugar phosphate isomerase/epimerase|nr:sugar phosphate isomerase/epimerase [Oscillospiraceae bacterium]